MAVKLSVGLSKKVGQPDYGSLGAHCSLELEVDSGLLHHDLDGFHRHVRDAYVVCAQAVNDELIRQQANHGSGPSAGDQAHQGSRSSTTPFRTGNGNGSRSVTPRPATQSQVRALWTIANRQQVDLARLVGERFQVNRPEDLTIGDASRLIDELKASKSEAGGRS